MYNVSEDYKRNVCTVRTIFCGNVYYRLLTLCVWTTTTKKSSQEMFLKIICWEPERRVVVGKVSVGVHFLVAWKTRTSWALVRSSCQKVQAIFSFVSSSPYRTKIRARKNRPRSSWLPPGEWVYVVPSLQSRRWWKSQDLSKRPVWHFVVDRLNDLLLPPSLFRKIRATYN